MKLTTTPENCAWLCALLAGLYEQQRRAIEAGQAVMEEVGLDGCNPETPELRALAVAILKLQHFLENLDCVCAADDGASPGLWLYP